LTAIKAIQSELIKLRYPPVFWLIGFTVLITLTIVFAAHYLNINEIITLGKNPWVGLNNIGQSIFSIFISIPLIILFISSAIFLEYKNNGFKQAYALPKNRVWIVIYKLIAMIMCILGTLLLLGAGMITIGYLLNFIYPESEFSYYTIPGFDMIRSLGYGFISYLGVIGIQFFLSLRFKSFLAPASFGILAYVVGLILSSINHSLSLYFPYCYPTIARENSMLDNSELIIRDYGIFNEVELYSIGLFLIFIFLSFYLERNRNI